MNQKLTIIAGLIVLSLSAQQTIHAQGMHGDMNNHLWPESIENVSVSGDIRIDTQGIRAMYFLDSDADGIDDYRLDFGPPWYVPPSGLTRPTEGETISIEGGLQSGMLPPTLTVFSLNQQTWRVANEYGATGWMMEPTWSSPGDELTVTGVVQADTSYFYHHFYLDTDSDGTPDYQLGLGPMWYSPAGDAPWPVDGSTVEVHGWLEDGMAIPMLVVISLDGELWRPVTTAAPWAGTWMDRNHTGDFTAYCVTDTTSSITFPGGHMMGMMGMMGMGWPDSTFIQFWNVHPDSLPGIPGGDTFMGFHINAENPTGGGMMGGAWGGRMGMIRFSQSHTIRLHYSEDDLASHGLSEDGLMAHWWDSADGIWRKVVSAQLDEQANTVSLTTSDLAQYYSLSASTVVTAIGDEPESPNSFVLHQNYPNPFNPSTTITFDVPNRQRVILRIFDMLGREVAQPVDQIFSAGSHQVTFDGQMLSSGAYLYRMETGGSSNTRVFTLLR